MLTLSGSKDKVPSHQFTFDFIMRCVLAINLQKKKSTSQFSEVWEFVIADKRLWNDVLGLVVPKEVDVL